MMAQRKGSIAALLFLVAPVAQAALPPDVLRDVQRSYASDGQPMPTRYVEARVDLNGDGTSELLVHVIGTAACGSGGCPTLVYLPLSDRDGYWRMATIVLTSLPIRVSATRSKGWRNLIVTVSGGGAEAGEVELAFDGKSYPRNPTVRGPRVTASSGGGDVVIAALASSDVATASVVASKRAADVPSFACAEASLPAEKIVCASRELAAMDQQLNETYGDAMRAWPADEQIRQRAAQKRWLAQRNACSKAVDSPVCLRDAYKRRQIELQIQSGKLQAPTPIGYLCKGLEGEPFSVAFYATDPPAAVLTRGDRQVVTLAMPDGSGTRYTAPGVEFSGHEGEASVTWDKTRFVCTPK